MTNNDKVICYIRFYIRYIILYPVISGSGESRGQARGLRDAVWRPGLWVQWSPGGGHCHHPHLRQQQSGAPRRHKALPLWRPPGEIIYYENRDLLRMSLFSWTLGLGLVRLIVKQLIPKLYQKKIHDSCSVPSRKVLWRADWHSLAFYLYWWAHHMVIWFFFHR